MASFSMEDVKAYMERLWDVLMGEYPPSMPREIPIVASLCYYALTVVLGRLLRHAVHRCVRDRWQPYALDLVVAFQLMACSLENSQINKHYGSVAYVGVMFTMGMWSYVTIAGQASSNPCSHVIRYMQGGRSILSVLGHVACQLIGGLLSFSYARIFWYLELTDYHASRYRSLHCTTDLTVPTPIGFLIEFSATFIDVLLCLTTFTPYLFYEVASKCLLVCLMVIVGRDLTGMYMNPINATNQTFGCRGISTWQHIVVYWLSVVLAAVLAVLTHAHLARYWKLLTKDPLDTHTHSSHSHTHAQSVQHSGGEGGKIRKICDEVKEKPGDSITCNENPNRNGELKSKIPISESVSNNKNTKPNGESMNLVTCAQSEKSTCELSSHGSLEEEILYNVEDAVIKAEATEVTEDVIFQAAESTYMKGESFDSSTIAVCPLNTSTGDIDAQMEEDIANANTRQSVNNNQTFIRDFESEYENMRRMERIHNFQNNTFATVDSDDDADGSMHGGRRHNDATQSTGSLAVPPRQRTRTKSGSRIPGPPGTQRKRSTSRSRIPVMKDTSKRRSRLKSE